MSTSGSVPVLILKEGAARSRGRTALRNNIMAAKIIGEVLKSTLGPRGMDKMLVDSLGDVTITNDGATILKEIDVQHPAAKIVVEASKAQDNEVGDGTTSVSILSSELLKRAEELIEKKIHPTLVVTGYKRASEKALTLLDELGVSVNIDDRAMLKKIAMTAMGAKSINVARETLADIAIDAIGQIAEKRDDGWVVDVDQVQVTKKAGESIFDTRLVTGVILDKEVVHPGMPRSIKDAKIALIKSPLEVEKTEYSAEIRIKDPTMIKAFLDEETNMLHRMVQKIKDAGANFVACQKGIDDIAQYFMSKEGIMAVRRVKESDIEKLSRATGADMITNLDDLTVESLGYAEVVKEQKIGEDKMVFVEGCKNPKSGGILIRGGLERFVDEAERAMHDSLFVIADIYKSNKIVAGGGAIETEIAKRVRDYASQVGGKEQLAIEAFADALESIPITLAENAGFDPIDIMVDLKAAHSKSEGIWTGVNVLGGGVTDLMNAGVVEPVVVKEQMIKSATEAASMVLRIDDMIASSKTPPMPGGMPGGMPPM